MSVLEFTEEQIGAAADRTYVDHAPPFDAERVARLISATHGVTWEQVKSCVRLAHLVEARREVYAALRERGWSYPAIARFVGGRNHTTVISALRKGTPEGDAAALTKKLKWAFRGGA